MCCLCWLLRDGCCLCDASSNICSSHCQNAPEAFDMPGERVERPNTVPLNTRIITYITSGPHTRKNGTGICTGHTLPEVIKNGTRQQEIQAVE